MIEFKSFTLENGLRVIVHEDPAVQVAVLNILYDVGSRDEHPEKTGFAHLFEHLMFGGSKNIANYDEALQLAGGENNAFTSTDITNYYMTLPAQNLETGFWLESDRMLSLSFDPRVLEVQRKVVIEEFKQRYLNQPYGDLWLKFRPLVYKKHSYQWPTIGKEISHIENATMEDVKAFFNKHYVPNQAIMVVAGKVEFDEVKRLSEKWFGPIPRGNDYKRSLPREPEQQERRFMEITADVPADALHMAFHIPGKFDDGYHAADLISDILGRGSSSRLYEKLVKESEIFSSIGASITGSIDPGLLIINGKVSSGIPIEKAEEEVQAVIDELITLGTTKQELEKVKNQAEASHVMSEVEVLNRAMNLAVATLSGDTNLVNEETAKIQQVTVEQINKDVKKILAPTNCSVLHYKSKQKGKI
ncbi:pitrilysin family protein [Fulvivirga kasyanovii]|uniref:Insulinase family protein n=1 Tax=Fulvivirga kasyanovii TaxID=396812 RepID=A0ABW9RNI2_9BACT|nr:pitrilysin family protein [Fulvivirga kasyanovii]MTI24495.1 insulinase family protein [Fulvivirga kasyanovii]